MPIFDKSQRKLRRGVKSNRRRSSRVRERGVGRSAGGTNNAKLAAAITVPIAVLGMVSYGVIALLDGEKADANHCYTRDDQHQAVVLIDNSIEGESGAHIRDYRTGLMRVYDNAPANAVIKIATTARTQGGSFAPPVFIICKPAATQTEQADIGAPEKSTPVLRRIAGEARGKYEAAVDQVIADASDPSKTALDSPIFEQLQAISQYDDSTGPNRSLTIITDGIANSETARFCSQKGALVQFEKFRKRRSYKYVEPRSFEGMDVTFLLVEHGKLPALGAPHCSNEELRDFWPEYFKGNGANSVDLRRLRYWQDS